MTNIIMSIAPGYCKEIFDGWKTVELRKSRPAAPPPYCVYVYCTKDKQRLLQVLDGPEFIKTPKDAFSILFGGKVVGYFICDEVAPITFPKDGPAILHRPGPSPDWQARVTEKSARAYCGDTEKRGLWAWHIERVVTFSRPKELKDVMYCPYPYDCSACGEYERGAGLCNHKYRPPQSWQYLKEG